MENLGGSQTSEFNILKFHMVSHIPDFIQTFGHPMNYDTGSFESAHRFNVKGIFKLTNKSQDAATQMLRHLSCIETSNVLSYVYDKQIGAASADSVDDERTEMDLAQDYTDDVDDDEKLTQEICGFEQRAFIQVIPSSAETQNELLEDLLKITGVKEKRDVRTSKFTFDDCVITMGFYLCVHR